MNTTTVNDSKFAGYATLLLRVGLALVSCRLWPTDSVYGARLDNRMSSGEISHGSWNTPTLSIGIFRRE